jgi:hypothetical protein
MSNDKQTDAARVGRSGLVRQFFCRHKFKPISRRRLKGPYLAWFFTLPVERTDIEELHECQKCGKMKYEKTTESYCTLRAIRAHRDMGL